MCRGEHRVERVVDVWTLRVALTCDARLIARETFDVRHDDTDAAVGRWVDRVLDGHERRRTRAAA